MDKDENNKNKDKKINKSPSKREKIDVSISLCIYVWTKGNFLHRIGTFRYWKRDLLWDWGRRSISQKY